jgi:hypothetical protein
MTRTTLLSVSRKTRTLSARSCFLAACDTGSFQGKQTAKASDEGSAGAAAFKCTQLCAARTEAASVFVIAPNLTVVLPVAMRFSAAVPQGHRVGGIWANTINKIQNT